MSAAERIRYSEVGSGWWPLSWGPLFAACGLVVELVTAGPTHPLQWGALAVLSVPPTLVWVRARRRYRSVLVTSRRLVVGGESLPVERIESVPESDGTDTGRVLGGRITVPRGTAPVPLLLRPDDGGRRRVLAWAADPEALRAALEPDRGGRAEPESSPEEPRGDRP
ncbi:DUF3093 family protein [Actinopolyspora mortivallis]|uniref:DUF3093 family protein n=1 Tax=Actinopolyspora mortivallis TaxID=33906 RepID=UPI000376ACBC|nr:DUF3093 family protein [Actinopolyspora mortivallis]